MTNDGMTNDRMTNDRMTNVQMNLCVLCASALKIDALPHPSFQPPLPAFGQERGGEGENMGVWGRLRRPQTPSSPLHKCRFLVTGS